MKIDLITRALMGQGMSYEEAEETRLEMVEAVTVYGEDPEDVLDEYDLSLDYIIAVGRGEI